MPNITILPRHIHFDEGGVQRRFISVYGASCTTVTRQARRLETIELEIAALSGEMDALADRLEAVIR